MNTRNPTQSRLISRAAHPVVEALESRAYFAVAVVGTGKGLVADFFSDNNLTNLVAARTDATVNFVWGTGSPGAGIPAEGFSTRWTGQVQAQFGEAYTFYTDTAGGVRLFVNGQNVINDWGFHARRTIQGTTAKLTAGQLYDVQLEYRDQGTSAVRLLWSSASAPTKAVIPTTQLYRVGSGAIAGGW